MLAKKTSKNQLTLPKRIVKDFPGIEYFDVKVENRKIVLMPVRITTDNPVLGSIREKMEKLGISGKDVEGAVKWARRRKR
ncbi:MAG: AbrB/MazE/SpoVT family DNA-binding domain-containing protein [Deltaproteobacteria bacterium]|nr:AbrB/MazE/SpoVT family DNA-binding domain-containing protein [Deltaproteobacteria bacterium]